jgi:hypothetical protein
MRSAAFAQTAVSVNGVLLVLLPVCTDTGLKKPGRLEANFTNTWFWADGTPLAVSTQLQCSASLDAHQGLRVQHSYGCTYCTAGQYATVQHTIMDMMLVLRAASTRFAPICRAACRGWYLTMRTCHAVCSLFALQATDYQRWSAAPRNADYTEDEAVCMEYLPQQPKTWNPFSCVSNRPEALQPLQLALAQYCSSCCCYSQH